MKSIILSKVSNRLTRYKEDTRRRNLPQPSFYAKLAERKRLADRVRRLRGVSSGPIYQMETKLGQKEIAKKAGVKTAGILQGPFNSLSEFDLDALPNKFVIKPNVGSGSNGVFLLEKKTKGLINIGSGEVYASGLADLHAAGLKDFEGCPLIAEELIELNGLPSQNWKIFAFFGELGFLRQVDLNKQKHVYKMWSPQGDDLGKIDSHSFPYDPTLPPPNDIDALVKAAKEISMQIMTPFVRVDLYESEQGPYLGEVTLRPGSLWKSKYLHIFTPEWDRKLGGMWEEAQARIIEKIDESYMP